MRGKAGEIVAQVTNIVGHVDPGAVPTETSDVEATLRTVFNTVYSIAAVVAVAFIIFGGYRMIMSQGEPQKIEEGQKTFTYAILGLIIVIVTALIINFIAMKLGADWIIGPLNIPTL